MQRKPNPKPTELAITLAALDHRYTFEPGWLYASQIAANLALLGFDTTGKRLAPRLGSMCKADAPWLERKRSPFDDYAYRVTRWGLNDLDNRLLHGRVVRVVRDDRLGVV
jgi:hypothetical protein